jgi:hypothetical protein
MPLDWSAQRTKLNSAKASTASAMAAVNLALTGFQPDTYVKRCAAGHTVHDGHLHIGSGWQLPIGQTPGAFVSGHYRTKDFMVAEKAVGSLGTPDIVMHELASFEGKLHRGPGLDDLVYNSGDDLVTNAVHHSVNGSAPWSAESTPPFGPRECCLFLEHDGYLYVGMGERYSTNPAPYVYEMPKDIWRRAPNGSWTLRNADVGFGLRSFSQVSYNGRAWMIGGADDGAFTGSNALRVDTAKIRSSDDGFETITDHGDGPFCGYGMRCTKAFGGVVMAGGASGLGSNFALSDKVFLLSGTGLSTCVELAPLPEPAMHIILGALTINGVETLAAINGYVIRNGVHMVSGMIYLLTDPQGEWFVPTGSDFLTE